MIRKYLIFSLTIILTSGAFANPTGGVVSSGDATITQSANQTVIQQNSDKAIINWQTFNIGAGEKTHFQQPQGGMTLNRINATQGPSQIYGQLTATGKIILVNQAGIFFGPGSYVNVGGIIASTSNISDQNFLAGKFIFDQPSLYNGSIINKGTIIAAQNGLVAMIGNNITNEGFIQAQSGNVVLASGKKFTVDLYGDQLINFTVDEGITQTGVDENGNALSDAVKNNGSIIADGGKILMTAKTASQVVDNVINMQGVAQARSVSQVNGQIILSGDTQGKVVVSGVLDASGKSAGQKGGTVKVLGNNVELQNPTNIDVSGDIGGGEILIGGNYQGKGPEINALTTIINPNVTLNADALTLGDGGNIIAWSDQATFADGLYTARGGALGGNGGLIETSGHYLEVGDNTHVDLSAPLGNTGTWLLDPFNVTISTAANSNGNYDTSGNPYIFTPTANSNVNIATLVQNLNSANVIISTGIDNANPTIGNITVSDPITWGSSNYLYLQANNNITLNGVITMNGAGAQLILESAQATGFITQSANPLTGLGNINGVGQVVKKGAGILRFTIANSFSGGLQIDGGIVDTGVTGSAHLLQDVFTSTTGTFIFNGGQFNYNGTGNSPFANPITLNAVGGAADSTILDPLGGTINVTNTNTTLTLNGKISGAGSLTKKGNAILTLGNSANDYAGGTYIVGGSGVSGGNGILTVSADGNLGTGGNVTITGGALLRFTVTGSQIFNRTLTIGADGSSATNGLQVFNGTSSPSVIWSGAVTNVPNNNAQLPSAVTGTLSLDTVSGAIKITGNISDAGSGTPLKITKVSVNTATLTGTNSYYGVTTISGGTLQVGDGVLATGSLGNSTSIVNNAALTLNSTGSMTIGGVISGSGTIAQLGSGATILTGNNTYTGATTVTAGTLSAGNANALGATSAGTTVSSGATLDINGTFDVINGVTLAAEPITINGGGISGNGALTGSGLSSVSGPITLASASTIGANLGANFTIAGNITGSGLALALTGAGNGTISSVIGTFAGTVTKNGTGTWALSNTNTFSGAVTINSGILNAAVFAISGTSSSLGTGSTTPGITIGSAGTLQYTGTTPQATNRSIILSGSGGTIDASGTNGGSLTINGGITGPAFGLVLTGTGIDSAGGIINGVIGTTTGTLTKNGIGAWTLSGTNTFSGDVTINAGTIAIPSIADLGTSSPIGSGALIFNGGALNYTAATPITVNRGATLNAGGGTINLSNGGILKFTGGIIGAGGLTVIGSGTFVLGGTSNSNNYSGNTIINGANLQSDNSVANLLSANSIINIIAGNLFVTNNNIIAGLTGNGTVDVASNTTLSIGNNTTDTIYNGSIIDGGALTKIGSNTLTLSGANTYSGLTQINAGTLQYGVDNALGSTDITVNGGTLDIVGYNDTVGKVTLVNGSIIGVTGLLTGTSYALQSGTVSARLAGSGSISKTTSGSVTLSGANTYSGTTTISEGTLSLTNVGALGNTTSTTVASGATLDINLGALTLSNASPLTLNGSGVGGVGALTFSSANLGVSTDFINSNITLGSNTTIGGAGYGRVSVISGLFSLTKIGSGTLILSGGGSYTGGTTISGGTLSVTSTLPAGVITLQNSSTLSFNRSSVGGWSGSLEVGGGGGTLENLGSGNVVVGSVTHSGTGSDTLTFNASVGDISIGGMGNAQGTLNIVKNGAKSVIFTGTTSFNYSGSTIINEGAYDFNMSVLNTLTMPITIGSNGILKLHSKLVLPYVDGAGAIQLLQAGDDNLALNDSAATGSTTHTYGGIISGSGGITKNDSSNLTLTGSNTYSGRTQINGGSITANAIGDVGSSSIGTGILSIDGGTLYYIGGDTVTNRTIMLGASGAVFDVISNTILTLGSSITGTTVFTKSNSGTLVLSGSNDYVGNTTISGGTLRAGSTSALSSNTNIIINNGATLSLTDGGAGNYNNRIKTLNDGTNPDGTSQILLGSATLTIGGVASTNMLYHGSIQGTGGLTLLSVGIPAQPYSLTLYGVNTYSGATNVGNAITLAAGAGNTFSPNSAVWLGSGSLLNLSGLNNTIGSLNSIAGAQPNINLGAGNLTIGADNTANYITSYGSNVAGAITGTGKIIINGTANSSLTLLGANTYSGGTQINGGTLIVSSIGNSSDTSSIMGLGSSSIILAGGTLSYSGLTSTSSNRAITVQTGGGTLQNSGSGLLTWNGAVAGNGVFTVDTNINDITFSNSSTLTDSSGILTLTKIGGKTLTLQGANNNYSGGTNISFGTLSIGAIADTGTSTSIGTQGITIGGGGQLTYTGGAATTNRSIAIVSGGGFLSNTGSTLTYTGAITHPNSGNDTLTVTATGAIAFSSTSTISNAAGTLALTKLGTNTLTIDGTNTYSGATTITAGTLTASVFADTNTASSLGTGSSVSTITLGSTGVLQYIGSGDQSTDRPLALAATGAAINVSGSGSLTLNGSVTLNNFGLTVMGTGTGRINGVIGPTGTLTKNGSGTWTLGASNTYTGLTTINAGTLLYGVKDAINTGGITINSGGTLDLGTFSDTVGAVTLVNGTIANGTLTGSSYAMQTGTVSAILAGSGVLTKSGTGNLTLSNANTFSGGVTFTAGTITVGNNTALGSGNLNFSGAGATLQSSAAMTLANTYTLNNNATLGGSNNLTLSGNGTLTTGTLSILNTGVTTLSGNLQTGAGGLAADTTSGTVIISGANSAWSGSTTLTSGTLQINAASNALGSGSLVLNGGLLNSSLAATLNNNYTVGSGGSAINGSNNLTLGGTGTLNGLLTVTNTGTTKLGGNLQAGSGGLTANTSTSGILAISGADNSTWSGTTTLTSGTLRLDVASNALGTGSLVLNGGSLQSSLAAGVNNNYTVGAGGSTINGSNNLTLGGTGTLNGLFTVTNTGTTVLSGNLQAGVGGLTANTSGILAISGANNSAWSGTTTLTSGTLRIDSASNALGTGSLALNGGSLQSSLAAGVNNNYTVGAGGSTINGSNNLTLGGAGALTGILTNTNTATTTLSGNVTSSGGVTQNGAGTLILSGANQYRGATNITLGTLSVQSTGGLGNGTNNTSGVTVSSGSVLDFSFTAGTLLSTSNINLNGTGISSNGALTISTANDVINNTIVLQTASSIGGASDGTLGGIISGSNALTKVGSNNIILSGANTYGSLNVDSTSINAGTLTIGTASNPLGIGKLVLNGGALASSGNFSIANAYSMKASSTLGGSNNITLSGAGTLTTGTLSVTNTGTTTLSGNLQAGSGGLTANTSGILAISGANNSAWSGTTTLTSGTLRLDSASNALGTGSLALNGGLLQSSLASVINNVFTVGAGGSTINGSNNLTLGGAGTLTGALTNTNTAVTTLSGNVTSTGGITQNGAGTLILSGANQYRGATNITSGTLSVQSIGGLGNGANNTSGVTVSSGSVLDFSFTAGTLLSTSNINLNGTGISNNGALTISTANDVINNTILLQTASSIGGAADGTLGGIISGGALTKVGNNNILLSGANTYSGGTTINAGRLNISTSNTALGTGAVNVTGALGIVGSTGLTIVNNFTLNNGSSLIDDGSGSNVISSAITVSGAGNATVVGNNAITLNDINSASAGVGGLTLQGSGVINLNGVVGATALANLTTNFATTVNIKSSAITTTGTQNYNGNITFANVGTTTLNTTNNAINFAAISSSNNTTLTMNTGSGNILFSGSIGANGNKLGALTLNSSGSTTLNGAVNAASIVTDALGSTVINGGSITTTGSQIFNDALTLGANTNFTAGNAAISLLNSNNSFTHQVSFTNTGSNDVTVLNSAALNLGTSNIGGNLLATSSSAISQSGSIIATGISTHSVGGVTLTDSSNSVGSFAAINTGGGDIQFNNDPQPLSVGLINQVGGGAVNISNDGDITLDNTLTTDGGAVQLISTIGSIVETGSGLINASGQVSISSATGMELNGANTITQFHGYNSTSGNINLTNTADTLTIVDLASPVGYGIQNTVNNGGISITNTGAMTNSSLIETTNGNISLTTLSAGPAASTLTIGNNITTSGGDISLNAANNSTNTATALIVNGNLDTGSGLGGGLTISGGLALNVSPVIGAGDIALQGNGLDLSLGTVNFAIPVTVQVVQNITITGNLTTSNGNNLVLESDYLHSGTGGVIIQAGASVVSSGDLTIFGSNGVGTSNAAGIDLAGAISASGAINLNSSAGVIELGANVTSSGGDINFTNAVTVANSVAIDAGTHAINFLGTVNGPGLNLTLQNNTSAGGTVTFADNVTLGGLTTFAQPYAVLLNGSTNSFSSLVNFLNTDGVTFAGSNTFTNGVTTPASSITTLSGNITTTNAAISLSSGGTVNLNNNSSLTGSTITLGNVSSGAGLYNLLIANSAASSINQYTQSGSGIGSSLSKSGSGVLTLQTSGSNYSGTTTITDGTLRAGDANVFSSNSTISLADAILDLNNFNQVIASLDGGSTGGNVTLGSGTLSTGDLSSTYSGAISGSGNLVKQGAGTFNIAGTANTYTGTTSITGGTLSVAQLQVISNQSSLGNATSAITIDNGTLKTIAANDAVSNIISIGTNGGALEATGILTLNGVVNGTGPLTLQGSGQINLNGAVSSTLTTLTSNVSTLGINTDITTTGLQTYNSSLILNTTPVLSSSGTGILFNGSINSANGTQGLVLADNTGPVSFNALVGNVTALANLIIGAGNTTTINTGAINTSGDQIYHSAVNLNANTALTSDQGNIILNAVSGNNKTLSLNGGAGNNSFIFNDVIDNTASLTVDGGSSGTDIIDFSPLASARTVTLSSSGTNHGFDGVANFDNMSFNNINGVIANTSAMNTLVGTNAPSHWVIASANTGAYTAADTLTFSNFQNLTGGTDVNTFNFGVGGRISGTVNGGNTNHVNEFTFADLTSLVLSSIDSGIVNLMSDDSRIASFTQIQKATSVGGTGQITIPTNKTYSVTYYNSPTNTMGEVGDPFYFVNFTITNVPVIPVVPVIPTDNSIFDIGNIMTSATPLSTTFLGGSYIDITFMPDAGISAILEQIALTDKMEKCKLNKSGNLYCIPEFKLTKNSTLALPFISH